MCCASSKRVRASGGGAGGGDFDTFSGKHRQIGVAAKAAPPSQPTTATNGALSKVAQPAVSAIGCIQVCLTSALPHSEVCALRCAHILLSLRTAYTPCPRLHLHVLDRGARGRLCPAPCGTRQRCAPPWLPRDPEVQGSCHHSSTIWYTIPIRLEAGPGDISYFTLYWVESGHM